MKRAARYFWELAGILAVVIIAFRVARPGLVDTVAAGAWLSFVVVWTARFVVMPSRRRKRRAVNIAHGRPANERDEIPEGTRRKVMRGRFGHRRRCRMCWWRAARHLHHVWAHAWGGADKRWNFRPLCADCNIGLSDRVTRFGSFVLLIPGPTDWQVWVGTPVGVLIAVRFGGFPL